MSDSITFSYPVPSLTNLEALQVASTGQIVRESNGALIANTEANRPLGALEVVWSSGSTYIVTPPAGAPDGDYQFFVYLAPTWADDDAAVGQSNVQNNDGGEYVDTGEEEVSQFAELESLLQSAFNNGGRVSTDHNQYNARTLQQGDSYSSSSRSFVATIQDGAEWPTNLTGYTLSFASALHPDNDNAGSALTGTVSIETATGDSRAVRVTITSAVTLAAAVGLHTYQVKATLTGGIVWTLETGVIQLNPVPA